MLNGKLNQPLLLNRRIVYSGRSIDRSVSQPYLCTKINSVHKLQKLSCTQNKWQCVRGIQNRCKHTTERPQKKCTFRICASWIVAVVFVVIIIDIRYKYHMNIEEKRRKEWQQNQFQRRRRRNNNIENILNVQHRRAATMRSFCFCLSSCDRRCESKFRYDAKRKLGSWKSKSSISCSVPFVYWHQM